MSGYSLVPLPPASMIPFICSPFLICFWAHYALYWGHYSISDLYFKGTSSYKSLKNRKIFVSFYKMMCFGARRESSMLPLTYCQSALCPHFSPENRPLFHVFALHLVFYTLYPKCWTLFLIMRCIFFLHTLLRLLNSHNIFPIFRLKIRTFPNCIT